MIAIIILSILLGLSILLLILFGRAILYQYNTILGIQKYVSAVDFLNGNDIDENLILNRYHGTLVVGFQLSAQEGSIWDLSLYEKKRIIGLTYFVTKQNILERLMANKEKFVGFEDEELLEILTGVLEDLQNDVFATPNTEVIQMKDGEWLFRNGNN